MISHFYQAPQIKQHYSQLQQPMEEMMGDQMQFQGHPIQEDTLIKLEHQDHPPTTDSSPKQQQKSKHRHKGHWQKDQKLNYHLFLQTYSHQFFQKKLRRIDKIFKMMSQFIKSRAADQCRSHHQKMQKKHKDFKGILKNLRKQNFGNAQSQGVLIKLREKGLKQPDYLVSRQQLQGQIMKQYNISDYEDD